MISRQDILRTQCFLYDTQKFSVGFILRCLFIDNKSNFKQLSPSQENLVFAITIVTE